jgi:hypothetical protein
MCEWCGREAPPEVASGFAEQFKYLAPGALAEAIEKREPPNIWTMRAGGRGWGTAKFICPDLPRAEFIG